MAVATLVQALRCVHNEHMCDGRRSAALTSPRDLDIDVSPRTVDIVYKWGDGS